MANIKFSQFTQKTTLGTVDFLVGYTGADNVQIDPADLLSGYSQGTGAAGQVTFFSAASTVTGDNDFYWDNTNKRLGIGTATPGNKLEVQVTSNGHGVLFKSNATQIGSILRTAIGGTVSMTVDGAGTRPININNSSSSNVLIANGGGNVGVGTTSPVAKLQVEGSFISSGISQLGTTGANVYLTSTSAGNVGIGTSGPSEKLHVQGNVLINGAAPYLSIKTTQTGTPDWKIYNSYNSVGDLAIVGGSSVGNKFNIQPNGNVGIGTSSPSTKLHVTGIIQSVESGNSAFYGGDYVRVFNNQNFRFRNSGGTVIANIAMSGNTYFNGGNVGIGTTSPAAGLQVAKGSSTVPAAGASTASACFGNNVSGDDYGVVLGADTSGSGYISAQRTDGTATAYNLYLQPNGGNVGIGTTSTTAKLNSISPDGSTNSLKLGRSDVSSFWNFNHAGNDLRIYNGDGSGSDILLGVNAGGTIYDNKVGIGTSIPAEKLDVLGKVRSTHDANNYMQLESNSGGGVLSGKSSGTVTTIVRTYGDSYFNGGNFGIGTSSPTQKLDVVGRAIITKNGEVLRFNSSDANGSFVTWQNNGSAIGYIGAGYHLWASPNNIATSFGIRAQTRLDLGIQADVYMTMLSSGNVGIGTTSPGVKFVVNGGSDNEVAKFLSTDDTAQISISDNNTDAFFGVKNGLAFISQTGGTPASGIAVDSSGNVGIGTSSPASRLEVDGGDIEVDDSASGLILRSPDGTRYRVTVANGGTLSVSAV